MCEEFFFHFYYLFQLAALHKVFEIILYLHYLKNFLQLKVCFQIFEFSQ